MVESADYKLKKLISELENIRGRHTELISLYIPKGYALTEISGLLANEISLTQNVKSKTVRNNVIDALTKIQQYLKLYKKNPENGLVIFCGNVSESEGKTDIKIWTVEPPESVKIKLYWCDQTFELAHLKDMVKEKEVYGLLVVDTQEATFGVLRGKAIRVLRHLDSIVPGKSAKGGQCVLNDTLMIMSDGNLTNIGNAKDNTNLKAADFDNFSITNSPILDVYKTNKQEIFKVVTKYPRLEIESSKDHFFFVFENGEIIEKPAEELREGDTLLMPEKIDIEGETQKLYFNFRGKDCLEADVAQVLGYFLGDGNFDKNRIVFSEGNFQLAKSYKKLIDNTFDTECGLRFRKGKNYYAIKCYGKDIEEGFRKNFFPSKSSLKTLIPEIVLKSKNNVLASFLRGLFDADGSVSLSSKRASIGINNKQLARQIQLSLLRFGVISSILEYDNRKNQYTDNHRFTIEISEKKSLKLFKDSIGFSSKNNIVKLSKLIRIKTDKSNVRQILVSGSKIRKIIEQHGFNKQDFYNASDFLLDKKKISKGIFEKWFIKNNKNDELKAELKKILECGILPVKIHKIEKYEKDVPMADIAVKHQSFIANGIFVHNSAQRFERVRDGLINDFFKKVAETAKGVFDKEMLGIIIGGPGPSKNEFFDRDYLETQLKNKVLGVKDVGYTDEHGLEELVERSPDILAKAAIAKEKELLDKFFTHLKKDTGLVAYGLAAVMNAMKLGAASILLVSEQSPYEEIELICSCGHSEKKAVRIDRENEQKCSKCGQLMKIIGKMDMIDAMEELAKQYGTTVEIVSRDTREGEQLYQIGGIGAILRYKLA